MHTASLAYMDYSDIRTGGNEAEIFSNLSAAEAVYAAGGSQRMVLCSWITAEFHLRRGDIANGRSGLEHVISSTSTLADP